MLSSSRSSFGVVIKSTPAGTQKRAAVAKRGRKRLVVKVLHHFDEENGVEGPAFLQQFFDRKQAEQVLAVDPRAGTVTPDHIDADVGTASRKACLQQLMKRKPGPQP